MSEEVIKEVVAQESGLLPVVGLSPKLAHSTEFSEITGNGKNDSLDNKVEAETPETMVIGSAENINVSGDKTEQKSKTIPRRSSLASFRKLFQKHSRSLSASPASKSTKFENGFDEGKRLTKSDRDSSPGIPLTPGDDDIFEGDSPKLYHARQSSEPSTATTSQNRGKLRHTHTLPAFFISPQSSIEEKSELSPGMKLWRKLGSFNFNRRLSPSSSSELTCAASDDGVDSVYQVLKEGLVLRACSDPPNSKLMRGSSVESTSGLSAAENGSSHSSPSRVRMHKRKLVHQVSDPTFGRQNDKKLGSHVEKAEVEGSSSSSLPNSRVSFALTSPTSQPNSKANKSLTRQADTKRTKDNSSRNEYEKLAEGGNLFVALHKYMPQHEEDLSLRLGDRICLTDDKDDSWWIGECGNNTGYFPAKFVMPLRPREEVHICVHSTVMRDANNKEVPLKKNQVVAVKRDWPKQDEYHVFARSCDAEGYLRKDDLRPL
ncbi:unnamed protein product [Clavelina lepadiformis]|uniref:SH3 domain-containing protein n=1 Tax=Clavelina lepadiformis TaxID=159417 RepID=A0ABP0FI74_CLALP